MSTSHAEALSNIVDSLGSPEFPGCLMEYFFRIVEFDCFVVLGYPESGELAVFHDGAPETQRVSCTPEYREGMWLFSPLYLHARQGGTGFFHISDISGPAFKTSNFYTRYYQSSGIEDQLAYIARNDSGETMAISIERSSDFPVFSATEKQALREIEPLVSSLLKKNWGNFDNVGSSGEVFASTGHNDMLNSLGITDLTPREKDTLLGLLKGLPNKSIARELDISPETVKVYCKQINRKLGVNNRNELFARVLQIVLSDK